jgi:signal transduction histidine kinase
MLAGILFLSLILVVAVLITVDVLRTPTEAPAVSTDRHGHDPERTIAAARGGAAVPAFSREPAVRDKPGPAAAAGMRFGAGPAEAGSFDRPDETARSFDQMRRELSQSAASEAALRGKFNAMYVNLSRRTQALVERQLRLIESLEHGEHDAQRLVGLSKLNRIAMRMHRNSQNLLVLAGQEPARNWNQPVTLAHLVETAMSEVEDYERVSFQVQPDIAVHGPAVHDAVHLLVELIDNATSFSAAEMPVHITGRILTSGGALVDVTDRGIGMPAKEMAYANQQLDNPPAPDIEVPKWMGLLVVARLAARHGIRVRLNQAELGGLTALVWFPDEILTHYSAAVDPGLGAAEPGGPALGPAALAAARMTTQNVPVARPDRAWSARSPEATVPAQPPAAARLVGSGRRDATGDVGVVLPDAETNASTRRLPIFDEVESRWSRGGREAPSSASLAAAPGPGASGPAMSGPAMSGPAMSGPAMSGPAMSGPATAGSTAGRLPRRPPPAAQGPRTGPGTPPGAPNHPGPAGRDGLTGSPRGASPGWAPPSDEGNPGGQDEP